jgi:hypothetical protein
MEHLAKQKLIAEGIMSALLSQDRRHSKKFCVSVFMGPRWSVTVNSALEKSRSVSDQGADINAQEGAYGNTLPATAFGGHGRVVKTLLDQGADINVQGGFYGNAL